MRTLKQGVVLSVGRRFGWLDRIEEFLGGVMAMGGGTRFMKRSLDIGVATAVLLLAGPAIVAVAALLWWRHGWPVFFRQRRPGQNGRAFSMIKFRTMRYAIGADGKPLPDDERLTRLGRFLRSTSVDELPTLWNVLRGEMSLVGPRPLLMAYLNRYTPQQSRRHEVKPGITGWAQVNGRNAIGWEEKFELDVWYVDHQSFGLDLKILWLTLFQVLKRSGINATGHATMPEFLGEGRQQARAA